MDSIFAEAIKRRGPWTKLYLPAEGAMRILEADPELWDVMAAAGELPPTRKVNGVPQWKISDLEATRAIIGTVYFIEMAKFIKIGFTRELPRRMAFYETLPFEVTLLHSMRGTIGLERFYHAKFKHLRGRGEWFRAEADLLLFIRERLGDQ